MDGQVRDPSKEQHAKGSQITKVCNTTSTSHHTAKLLGDSALLGFRLIVAL